MRSSIRFQRVRVKEFFLGVMALVLTLQAIPFAEASAKTVRGGHGEVVKVSASRVTSGQEVTVSGSRFDETVGIYLAFCVIPKKGELPSPCGGGINMSGVGEASQWISSNPPPYGKSLATPFNAGGRFTAKVLITRKIGSFDCKKVRCAITIRADHTAPTDRTHDIFIPIAVN